MKKCLAIVATALVLAWGSRFPSAQAPQSPAFNSDTDGERIENLGALKKELRDYHDCTCKCGCYSHDLDVQADRAIAFLRERVERRRTGEKLALILDIDETSLSNYQERSDSNFEYAADAFDAWVESSQAPAIAGTLRLYKEARRLGVYVFFISTRPEWQRQATERNLRGQGYDNWQQLALAPPGSEAEPPGAFKTQERGKIATEGYTMVLNVGDHWSDLKGKPEAEFSVKYPDPFDSLP